MKRGRIILALILALVATMTIFAGASLAAPKLDPELKARLGAVAQSAQPGVILTFQGTGGNAFGIDESLFSGRAASRAGTVPGSPRPAL